MKTGAAAILAAGVLLGCVALGILLRPSSGHHLSSCGGVAPVAGRYQLVSKTSSEGGFIFFYLLDTATGGCWVRHESPRSGHGSSDPAAHGWVAIPPAFVAQRKGK